MRVSIVAVVGFGGYVVCAPDLTNEAHRMTRGSDERDIDWISRRRGDFRLEVAGWRRGSFDPVRGQL
jgi:hypothetical protein